MEVRLIITIFVCNNKNDLLYVFLFDMIIIVQNTEYSTEFKIAKTFRIVEAPVASTLEMLQPKSTSSP